MLQSLTVKLSLDKHGEQDEYTSTIGGKIVARLGIAFALLCAVGVCFWIADQQDFTFGVVVGAFIGMCGVYIVKDVR